MKKQRSLYGSLIELGFECGHYPTKNYQKIVNDCTYTVRCSLFKILDSVGFTQGEIAVCLEIINAKAMPLPWIRKINRHAYKRLAFSAGISEDVVRKLHEKEHFQKMFVPQKDTHEAATIKYNIKGFFDLLKEWSPDISEVDLNAIDVAVTDDDYMNEEGSVFLR